MIRVCPCCSGADVDGLKSALPNEKIMVGCTGHCKTYPDQIHVFVDNQMVIAEYNIELINKVKDLVNNK